MLISKSYKVQNNLNYAWDLPKQTLQPAKESLKKKKKSPNNITNKKCCFSPLSDSGQSTLTQKAQIS